MCKRNGALLLVFSVTQLSLTAVSGYRSGTLRGESRIGQVFVEQLRGLERWLNGEEDQSLFPSTHIGHPPVTPGPGALAPSSGFLRHCPHMHRHTHTQTHTNT